MHFVKQDILDGLLSFSFADEIEMNWLKLQSMQYPVLTP